MLFLNRKISHKKLIKAKNIDICKRIEFKITDALNK